jgi:hypothetical protein
MMIMAVIACVVACSICVIVILTSTSLYYLLVPVEDCEEDDYRIAELDPGILTPVNEKVKCIPLTEDLPERWGYFDDISQNKKKEYDA